MHYTIKQLNNLTVSATTPLGALRKAIRKLVNNIKKQGGDIYEIKNEKFNIASENSESAASEYIISIVKSKQEKSIYYKLDYEIEIYKKLNNI